MFLNIKGLFYDCFCDKDQIDLFTCLKNKHLLFSLSFFSIYNILKLESANAGYKFQNLNLPFGDVNLYTIITKGLL